MMTNINYTEMITYHPMNNSVTLSIWDDKHLEMLHTETVELEIGNTLCNFNVVIKEMEQRSGYLSRSNNCSKSNKFEQIYKGKRYDKQHTR